MPLPFNKSLDLKLISLVKDNPVLYNSKHPKHMDFDSREATWQKIGDALARPGQVCKSRWINMRDMMRRKYKERLKNPHSRIYNYKYEEELSFTIPFFKDSRTPEDFADYLEEEANNCEVEMPAEVFTDDFDPDTKEIKLTFRKRQEDCNKDFAESILQELNPADPLDVFLITIGATLRKFNPYYLNQAKSKIFQVVQDFELQQIVKDSQLPSSSDAVEFAGIQCQIHYGDYQEDKHKPGLIENLNEYLPKQYASSRSIEKKILKEFSKHHGLSSIEAKYVYTKTARDLPTYGVTFFLVKEQEKKKKKLVPRLLGINAESILRLDEVTKEILQVWPLTQVKTYHAGKAETFTLNFGDYSDKEYSVKTNDAHRIRDILADYIDLIRKKIEANYNMDKTEHHAICEDEVQASRGHIMEVIKNNSNKIVEETFVGPSKIISYEPGQAVSQGTQIMTVQQVVVTSKGHNQQNAKRNDEVKWHPTESSFLPKLNRLNSSSVQIVTLLTEPSQANLSHVKKIVDSLKADLPTIIEGVEKESEFQTSEEAKRKLLADLQELCEYMKALSSSIDTDPEKALEASKKIADLSTRLCFKLDPGTMKRREFCRRSKQSFVQDEETEANMRRAALLAAAKGVCDTLAKGIDDLFQKNEGPSPDSAEVSRLERSAASNMDKMNAAVALYLTAYSDPKNVDYSSAANSMNALNQLMPKLIKDAKALTSVNGGKDHQDLLDQIKALCDAVRTVCLNTDPKEHEKMQAAGNEYGKVAEKLIFTFKRGANVDKRNEIIDLAKAVGDKTSYLLFKADELIEMSSHDPAAAGLDAAGVRCADAAKDLVTCATLTAPSINEPHCQSALTAAAESLSSSAQALALAWKPLVEDPSRKEIRDDLGERTMDLAMALDRLKAAYAGLNGTLDEPDEIQRAEKLKFIKSVADARQKVSVDELWNKPLPSAGKKETEEELKRRLMDRVAQLSAALAALVNATADQQKPDYATADLAVTTISELMPHIIEDSKALSTGKDEQTRAQMLAELKALCDVTNSMYSSFEQNDLKGLNDKAAEYANTSKRLLFVFNPREKQTKDNQILDISLSVNDEASKLLKAVDDLAQETGEAGSQLQGAGAMLGAAVNTMVTTARLTSSHIHDPRCQASLSSCLDSVSNASKLVSSSWMPWTGDSRLQHHTQALENHQGALDRELERLRKAMQVQPEHVAGAEHPSKSPQRLQFLRSAAAAQDRVLAAERELDKPTIPMKHSTSRADLQDKLYQNVITLNAAVADLVAAMGDRENPDYAAADKSLNAVNELLPLVIKDTKALSASLDEDSRAALLDELRALCDATRGIITSLQPDSEQELSESASTLGAVTGRLVYVYNPRANQDKEHQIIELSKSACHKAFELLNKVYKLAAEIWGDTGSELDAAGSKVADGAKNLLATAQLTAPSIQEPHCKSSLLSSVDSLEALTDKLALKWKDTAQDPKFKDVVSTLEEDKLELQQKLDKLRMACQLDDGGIKSPTKRAPPPPPPKRATIGDHYNVAHTIPKGDAKDINQEFLDQMRLTEAPPAPYKGVQRSPSVVDSKMKGEEEKLQQQKLAAMVDDGTAKIRNAEDVVTKWYSNADAVIPALSVDQALVAKKQMETKVAHAIVAAADLVAANNLNALDYPAATSASSMLSEAMTQMVPEAKHLRGALDESEQKSFLADVLAMFEAAKVLIGSAKNNQRNLNESTVAFAYKSAKVLYTVSTDVDPNQEKEIYPRASSIGDSASRLGVQCATAAPPLWPVGVGAANRAGTLIYTARLVAPCIQIPECQNALKKSIADLLNHLEKYSASWDTWAAESETPSSIDEMKQESGCLQKMLKELKSDLETGKLIKRREVERILVVNTPMRQLACSVLENAKSRAEQISTPVERRTRFAKYANELGQAIQQLDLAYSRSAQAPQDVNKRMMLENAVQNLQVTVLQSRPSQDDKPQNNIVDLTDYVKDVANEAGKLYKECKDLPELEKVKNICDVITSSASSLTGPEYTEKSRHSSADDDLGAVEAFAEECDRKTKAILATIEELNDGRTKVDMLEKSARLAESCDILRFAAKSAIATTECVTLDATLEELTDLEKKIDEMLVPKEKSHYEYYPRVHYGREKLMAAVIKNNGLVPASAAYLSEARCTGDMAEENQFSRCKKHLNALLLQLKTLTMASSRHVATWQNPHHPEVAEITQEILKELNSYQNEINNGKDKQSILKDTDIQKLLAPTYRNVPVDESFYPKLQHAASKLSSSVVMLSQGVGRPDAMSRSVHATVDAAELVSTLANSAPHDDAPGCVKKRLEDTREVPLQTYNVLKAAEAASQDPNNYTVLRRLADACRRLNEALNELVRQIVPNSAFEKSCDYLTRSLQAQQSVFQTPRPLCAASYSECLDAISNQMEVIQKMEPTELDDRKVRSLSHASAAVSRTTEYSANCAYLLLISERHRDFAHKGFVDVNRVQTLSSTVQDTCYGLVQTETHQAKFDLPTLNKQVQEFKQGIKEALDKLSDANLEEKLKKCSAQLDEALKELHVVVHKPVVDRATLSMTIMRILDATKYSEHLIESGTILPEMGTVSSEAKARSHDVVEHYRTLNYAMLSLIKEVKSREAREHSQKTSVNLESKKKELLEAFEGLLDSVRENGKQGGILEQTHPEEEESKKTFIDIQLDWAKKWLSKPTVKADVKETGEGAAKLIIELGDKLSEELKGQEKEEMEQLVAECKELLVSCGQKYDRERAGTLLERLKALKKAIERGVVTRVVEDFLEGEEPLADLDMLAEIEKDETKRKFLLERKIAELLAQLGRVSSTARFVATAGGGGDLVSQDLLKCSEQTQLLAPMLVKAAQKRVILPDDKAAIEHYQKLLAQYTESLANIRNLCDQAVDPMEFVQTAGETMQRMREETTHENDPLKCAYTSAAITKLANRVINVSMSSHDARKDPELQKALREVKERLKAAVPKPNDRPSRIPDWKITTAEILRTTGEVESVLGGEMIFKRQQSTDQPIFAAALDLHASLRDWSARDNELVAIAKRMAVLMAKLSDHMNSDRKQHLIATAKAIVTESHKVANLARKLANECTDVRIKTNLLQVCERIPTISGQLKMLCTVKGSLGHQGTKEDLEDMNTLVGNAQNLMLSVQEVVKAAAGASIKIMSQRGATRVRWRRNYY